MGNGVFVRLRFAAVLFAAVVLLTSTAYIAYADARDASRAPSRDAIAQRLIKLLCDREAMVGHRIALPLISPELCAGSPTPAQPTLDFSADPDSIQSGDSSALAWSSTNATSCTASNGWSGAKSLSGIENVSPTSDTTYTLTCSGAGGDVTKSVTVSVAPAEPQTATLTLQKIVVNDNGGTKIAADFQGKIDNANVAWNSGQTVSVGVHTASEIALAGYTAGNWGGDCAGDGTITLAAGDNKTCTITNNDDVAAPTTGHLVVDKVTQPAADATVFSITASGSGAITGGGAGTVTDASNHDYEVAPGTYSVAEDIPAGWNQTGNTCTDVVVAAGDTKNCTITNVKLPTLTVTKEVVNDNNGTKVIADFPLFVDGIAIISGESTTTTPGIHVVNETGDANYTATFGGDCDAEGAVTLAAGESKSCTITNDDKQPAQTIGHMVISEVQYDVASTTVSGNDSSFEWMELFNGTNSSINLQGWSVGDASSTDAIAASVAVQPGQFAVVVASTSPSGIPVGVPVIVLHSSIGFNGFGNEGDGAVLLDPGDTIVDQVGYGTNVTIAPNVGISAPHDGHSIKRAQLTSDNDNAGDWTDTATPTPGQ